MKAKLLSKDKLTQLIELLMQDHEVIGPKDALSYGVLESPSDMTLEGDKPKKSLKEFLFPQREILIKYRTVDGQMQVEDAPPAVTAPRVIFTCPCDAAALPIVDKVFSWDYVDSSYVERRSNSTIITIACDQPSESCFCVSLSGSPAGIDGSDVLLTALADAYHVQIISQRGKELIERYEKLFTESDEAHNRQRAAREDELREQMIRHVDVDGLAEAMDFEDPVWQTVTEQCIDCAICTFLCPTCHCFDIQDEGDPDAGERVRMWDSCASRLFTKTTVHEPRPTHASRYRQRIMHKFQYYPKNFGRNLCVGCGRCIQYCPVGIDITKVLETVRG